MLKYNSRIILNLFLLTIFSPSYGFEQKFHCPPVQEIEAQPSMMPNPFDPSEQIIGARAQKDGRLFTSHSWIALPLENNPIRIVYYKNGNMECYYKAKNTRERYALIFTNISGWSNCSLPKGKSADPAGATYQECKDDKNCYVLCRE